MDLPIYARGVSPNKPGKTGPGELNVPLTLGGVTVEPGDILVGDADGVVVVRPGEAADVAAKARAHTEGEQAKMQKILAEGRFDRPFVVEKLKELGYEV
jgi:regulator of RNase E activity RraA